MSLQAIRQLQYEIADIERNLQAMKCDASERTPQSRLAFSRLLAGLRRRKAKIKALEGEA